MSCEFCGSPILEKRTSLITRGKRQFKITTSHCPCCQAEVQELPDGKTKVIEEPIPVFSTEEILDMAY